MGAAAWHNTQWWYRSGALKPRVQGSGVGCMYRQACSLAAGSLEGMVGNTAATAGVCQQPPPTEAAQPLQGRAQAQGAGWAAHSGRGAPPRARAATIDSNNRNSQIFAQHSAICRHSRRPAAVPALYPPNPAPSTLWPFRRARSRRSGARTHARRQACMQGPGGGLPLPGPGPRSQPLLLPSLLKDLRALSQESQQPQTTF
jgi:hypothetical protein